MSKDPIGIKEVSLKNSSGKKSKLKCSKVVKAEKKKKLDFV
jgi:hypothetical protein